MSTSLELAACRLWATGLGKDKEGFRRSFRPRRRGGPGGTSSRGLEAQGEHQELWGLTAGVRQA